MNFLMCVLFVFGVSYVQANLTPEQVEKIKEYHTECIKTSEVPLDLVTKARQGDFAVDEKLKNHLFCVSKKIGFQNEDGKLQVEVLKAKVGAALGDQLIADSLIAECAKDLASGPETAFQTVKCYYEKTPTHISIV